MLQVVKWKIVGHAIPESTGVMPVYKATEVLGQMARSIVLTALPVSSN